MGNQFEKVLHVNLQDDAQTELVAKTLSNKARRDILRLLHKAPMAIWDIAVTLNLPLSSVSEHVSMLIKAGIVSVVRQSNRRGNSKIVARQYEKVSFSIAGDPHAVSKTESEVIAIPIGSYHSFRIHRYCGMINTESQIGSRDDPNTFYSPCRFGAGLLWLDYGYLEYRVPLPKHEDMALQNLSFALELCSEAPAYNENWPSDIYFEINGKRIGTYTCPGDFGARSGIYTPKWWQNGTQYGLVKTVDIRMEGSFLDGEPFGSVGIRDLAIEEDPVLRFRVGVDENAKNRGGLNLFGKGFGDRGEDILLTAYYKEA